MNRRQFLSSSSTALAALCLPLSPSLRAEPVSFATISTGFKLASGVMGFLNRQSDPTIPLIVSLSDAVEALGLKIDAINDKLDILINEMQAIRKTIEDLPQEIEFLSLSRDIREPWDRFTEITTDMDLNNPTSYYLDELPDMLRDLQISRRKFLAASLSGPQPVFDGVVDIALAQDAEIILSAEMLRSEIYDLGKAIDPRAYRQALRRYEDFFKLALDADSKNSILGQKALYINRIKEIVDAQSHGSTYLSKLTSGSGKIDYRCQFRRNTCNQWFTTGRHGAGRCSEPAFKNDAPKSFTANMFYSKSEIPNSLGIIEDHLNIPFLYSVVDFQGCEFQNERLGYIPPRSSQLGSGDYRSISNTLSSETKKLENLNLLISGYYRLHFTEEITLTAINTNQRIQSEISSIIG